MDLYVRLTERDGVLYRVVLGIEPTGGDVREVVQPLITAFFDQPLDTIPRPAFPEGWGPGGCDSPE